MAASVGTGGITTTSKNVFIPIQNANIGDAICIQNGTDGSSISHFKAVAGASVQATAPSGYTWYGSVYGRERRGLMIRSCSPISKTWASTTEGGVSVTLDNNSHPNVVNNSTTSFGTKRNGLGGNYPAMSVAECVSRIATNGTGSSLHPTSAYQGDAGRGMTLASFNADTNGAKTRYGTYANYIAQTCPNLKTGPFQFRCGKLNTKELATKNSLNGYSFPAAQYCYTFKVASEAANHWWLPDMYELYMMMCDNSFDACAKVHSIIGGNTARATNRWSSVRYSATTAWNYSDYGFASNNTFYYGFTVVPVTLLNLT